MDDENKDQQIEELANQAMAAEDQNEVDKNDNPPTESFANETEPQPAATNPPVVTVQNQTPVVPTPQPVAYTANGQPLYAQPEVIIEEVPENVVNPTATAQPTANQPDPNETPLEREGQRDAIDPDNPDRLLTPDELKQHHDDSVAQYPFLQFLPDEYVVIDVRRTKFGYLKNWLLTAGVAVFAILLFIGISFIPQNEIHVSRGTIFSGIALAGMLATLFSAVVAWIITFTFHKNYLIITNERVFRRDQTTPWSFYDQNIELSRIENCSYAQTAITQRLLNYGSISLETVGHEATYVFEFASKPRDQFRIVNMMVEEAAARGGDGK